MQLHTVFVCVQVVLGIFGNLSPVSARRGRGRQQSALSSAPKLEETRAHEWCPKCDISHCPMVTKATCAGTIVLDWCHCCPICSTQGRTLHGEPNITPPPADSLPHNGHGDLSHSFQSQNQSEACAEITCPKFQVCMLNIQGLPMCRCPTKFWCMKGARSPVCGQNDLTYKSKCFLKMAECESGKNIVIQRKGKCFKSEKDKQQKLERERQREAKKQERQERRRRRKEKQNRKSKRKNKKDKKKRHRREKNPKRWTKFNNRKLFSN